MDLLEKNNLIIELYDIYQEVLTEKQKIYFESYYFNDYSITEIAENEEVSRNAVHDQIKRTEQKLLDLEDKLHLRTQRKQRLNLYKQIEELNTNDEIKVLIEECKKVE